MLKLSPVSRIAMAALLLALLSLAFGQEPLVRPLTFGTSGGNINDSSKIYCCGGTLGGVLYLNGVPFIVSNNHVLARTNQAPIGESVIQPGLIDQAPTCAADSGDIVGALHNYKPILFTKGSTNLVDAAIASFSSGISFSNEFVGIGAATGNIVAPSINMHVQKKGRTTGITYGKITTINGTYSVSYQPTCGIGKKQTAKFVNQIRIVGDNGTAFSAGGDSGSVILDDSRNYVGLLFAGSSTDTIANRMSDVVAAFGGTAHATAPATPQNQRAAAIGRVKDRYDDFLLGLPEVVGHGVGLSEMNPGELVIQVFVRQKNDNVRRAAPPALEGIPVELVETGEYRAVPAAVNRPATCKK